MIFELTEAQQLAIKQWDDGVVKPKIKELQKDVDPHLTCNGEVPYAGAIGGRLTYSFTPTGLGTIVVVKCGLTDEELDLTEYDLW